MAYLNSKIIIKKITQLINQQESIVLEFKESKTKLNKDLYDTVCSFLNRQGGYILLGVDDRGSVIGVDKDKVE